MKILLFLMLGLFNIITHPLNAVGEQTTEQDDLQPQDLREEPNDQGFLLLYGAYAQSSPKLRRFLGQVKTAGERAQSGTQLMTQADSQPPETPLPLKKRRTLSKFTWGTALTAILLSCVWLAKRFHFPFPF